MLKLKRKKVELSGRGKKKNDPNRPGMFVTAYEDDNGIPRLLSIWLNSETIIVFRKEGLID